MTDSPPRAGYSAARRARKPPPRRSSGRTATTRCRRPSRPPWPRRRHSPWPSCRATIRARRPGTALADPLVVVVTDEFGNPVEGVKVSWDAAGRERESRLVRPPERMATRPRYGCSGRAPEPSMPPRQCAASTDRLSRSPRPPPPATRRRSSSCRGTTRTVRRGRRWPARWSCGWPTAGATPIAGACGELGGRVRRRKHRSPAATPTATARRRRCSRSEPRPAVETPPARRCRVSAPSTFTARATAAAAETGPSAGNSTRLRRSLVDPGAHGDVDDHGDRARRQWRAAGRRHGASHGQRQRQHAHAAGRRNRGRWNRHRHADVGRARHQGHPRDGQRGPDRPDRGGHRDPRARDHADHRGRQRTDRPRPGSKVADGAIGSGNQRRWDRASPGSA